MVGERIGAAYDAGVRVLVVEDEASAVALVTDELRALAEGGGLVVAATLEEGIAAAEVHAPDCAVLDLSLPDGWGLDTLLTFRRRMPEVPVVVVSGTQGPAFEGKARRAGAAAFLTKSTLEPGTLADKVAETVAAARAGVRPTDVVSELSSIARRRSPVSARIFGQVDLRDALADRFDDLVAQYADLLELAMERTAFEGDYGVSDHLRDLAASLGAVGAGPRDVVQIHAKALESEAANRQGRSAPEFVHEARLVVLELMGYLVSYYRAQALGLETPGGRTS